MILTLLALLLNALTLAACLAHFLLLKRELWRQDRSAAREQVRLQEAIATLSARVDELQAEVQGQACYRGAPDNGALNFTRRTRALRLHRRGDRPDQIAAALKVPQNEVALLLKMQEIS
jgi:hypothetical protein